MIRTLMPLLLLQLLLATPLYCASEQGDTREALDHEDSSAVSGEHLQDDHKQLELEDLERSTSMEEVNDDETWNHQRERRSLEKRKPTKVEDLDDLEEAESVVFMPAHLRQLKKMSFQECRNNHQNRKTWRSNNPSTPEQVIWECNTYCCYPVVQVY